MSRLVAVVIAWVIGGMAAVADEPKPTMPVPVQNRPVTEPSPEMVPDPSWIPKPGDQVVAYCGDVSEIPMVRDDRDFGKFIDTFNANDIAGLKQLIESNKVFLVPSRTKVLVRYSLPIDGTPALLVRVLDGVHKDELVLLPTKYAARLIGKPPEVPGPVRVASRPIDSRVRAATLLQSAKNLERSGKLKPAIEGYQRIIDDFPGTPSAVEASVRLKAIKVSK